MEDVHNLMRKVTLDDRDHGLLVGSDPSLLAVRRKIAARWASLRPPAFTGTPEESQNGTCQFKKQLVQLVDMYGTESPFAPEPLVLQILEHSEQPHQPPVPDVEAAEDRVAPTMLSASFKAGRGYGPCCRPGSLACNAHSHVFLNLWELLLQVEESASLDGYKNFVAIAESWRLKTPFTQWFTKNYAGVFLPLCHLMDVGPGHVRRSGSSQRAK